MLSTVNNYAIVSEETGEDFNVSEETLDNSSSMSCRESLLANTYSPDNVETQTARVVSTDLTELCSNSDEAVQENYEETSDNTLAEEEMCDNQITTITGNMADDNLTSVSGVSELHHVSLPLRKTSECASPSDSSENLLLSDQRREPSVEDSDESFLPFASRKANSADDLLDKNFVKWHYAGGASTRSNRERESTMTSDSPSSDVEFSASSSVTGCTEDSGISSTVRDDELEEIPLNSSRFSPELYKQISRLSVDESVAAWIPKSSNTYAPSLNSNAKVTTDETDDSKSQKQSKLK